MEYVMLVRYANEGFENHPMTHIYSPDGPVFGCYAFIEKEHESILNYKEKYLTDNPHLVNRSNHTKNELLLPVDTTVYVKNKKLPTSSEEIFISPSKETVIIPEAPIQPFIQIQGMEFPVNLEAYVKVSLGFAKTQLEKLMEYYEWIKKEGVVQEEISINTKVIDYCQCIIHLED